jgi:23S rRNA (adenine2503-C2)-methyltransferase
MSLTDLKELSKPDLESFLKALGAPAFRTRQILHWIYEKYTADIQEITELSKEFRQRLSEVAHIGNISLLDRKVSSDGTEKYLFGLEDGESVESVLIPDDDRLTLCISSQAGCALGCRFCLTGAIGLRRNLKPHEVVDQVISVSRAIRPCTLTNVVMMGMGEPLANFDNVIEALWRLTELVKISPRRVTLSTAGIVPKIIELARKGPKVNLAISLNATTDEVRDRIMPVNRAHPLRELLKACREFPLPERRRITFEYVLLKGVNDSIEDAHRLAKLLKGIPSKVNLIPFNPYEGSEFERPGDEVVAAFQEVLLNAHMTALVRKSKGRDISAACGQLRAGREAGLYT